jgi:hypothetical protein
VERGPNLNTCQRALAEYPAKGSPKGDMSGSKGGKLENGKWKMEKSESESESEEWKEEFEN